MSGSSLTPDIDRFLFTFVHSYEELEALLLLQRDASRPWTSGDVARALSIDGANARIALQRLVQDGVVEETTVRGSPHTCYRGPREAFRALVSALSDAFEHHKIDVIAAMNRNALERMRTDALRVFADAFVIRRRDG